MELSYAQIKSANEARESEEQRTEHRKRSLILLIHGYLTDQGYLNSASSLIDESGISLRKFSLCDNIDLETILQEFNTFYSIKFGKSPKIVKKAELHVNTKLNGIHRKQPGNLPRISESSQGERPPKQKLDKRKTKSADRNERGDRKDSSVNINNSNSNNNKRDSVVNNTNSTDNIEFEAAKLDMGLTGTAVQGKEERKGKVRTIIDVKQMIHDTLHHPDSMPLMGGPPGTDDKLLKPLAMFANRDMRELAAIISRDIYLNNPNVRWGDIFGLDDAKRVLKEAVVYPIKYPQLFTGILSPWKGLLLYGPPGTGKTLLAKAVATECKTTFFNISASSIVSKWRGDSEKLVRVLFELARYHAPSTIFVDEIECLISQRGGSGGSNEHEGSLRMKTELLVQMDGLAKSDDLVFLLAASNLPWELDHAMLRRLEKRILVDLPTLAARKQMFRWHLPPLINQSGEGVRIEAKVDYDHLGDITTGYTGSDIHLVCKEAVMSRVRKIFSILEDLEANPKNNANRQHKLQIEPVTTDDVKTALKYTKPSAQNMATRYESWRKKYEST